MGSEVSRGRVSGAFREAAALVALFRDRADSLRVVLIRRGSLGRHASQLALPGGNREPPDKALIDTVLREVREEVGLEPSMLRIVAELPPVRTRTTGIAVTPFVASIDEAADMRPDGVEVVEVLSPAVAAILDPERREKREMEFPGWSEARLVEVVPLDEGLLWGFTLRLLDEILPRALAREWAL